GAALRRRSAVTTSASPERTARAALKIVGAATGAKPQGPHAAATRNVAAGSATAMLPAKCTVRVRSGASSASRASAEARQACSARRMCGALVLDDQREPQTQGRCCYEIDGRVGEGGAGGRHIAMEMGTHVLPCTNPQFT